MILPLTEKQFNTLLEVSVQLRKEYKTEIGFSFDCSGLFSTGDAIYIAKYGYTLQGPNPKQFFSWIKDLLEQEKLIIQPKLTWKQYQYQYQADDTYLVTDNERREGYCQPLEKLPNDLRKHIEQTK